PLGSRSTALVVNWNGEVILEQSHPQLEAQGVIVGSLERGLREHGSKLEPLLGSLLDSDYDRYVAIAQMIRAGGAFVWVPDGVDAAVPIRLIHGMEGGGRFTAPHTVVALGRNARATVIEELSSETGEGISFHDGATEVFVGD